MARNVMKFVLRLLIGLVLMCGVIVSVGEAIELPRFAFPVATFTPGISSTPTESPTVTARPTDTPTLLPSATDTWTPLPSDISTPTLIPSITPTQTKPPLPTPTHTIIPAPTEIPGTDVLIFASRRSDTNQDGSIGAGDLSAVYMMDIDGSNLVPLTPSDQDSFDPSATPDGQLVVFTRASGDTFYIYGKYIDSGSEFYIAEGMEPAVSPDGESVTYRCVGPDNDDICLASINGDNARFLTHANANEANWYPRWAPDEELIYFLSRRVDTTGDGVVVGCDNAQVINIDPNTGSQQSITDANENITGFNISPDGRYLAMQRTWENTPSADGRRCGWNDSSELQLFDLQTNRLSVLIPQHEFSRTPAFSPDGEALIYMTATSDYNGDGALTINDARSMAIYDLVTERITYVNYSDAYQSYDLNWVRRQG
jgi:Tol biopolymer transport system component